MSSVITLSPEQQTAFSAYKAGKNVLVTGPGGTGKSELIRHIVADAAENDKVVQVCALTGCAADQLRCKARTIHSWAGLGLATGSVPEVVDRIYKQKQKRSCWNKTDMLIIDEVSMMSSKLLNILDLLARKVRRNPKPFGGMQLMMFGDFYQLPPVGNRDGDDPESAMWAFEYHRWDEIVDEVIELKTMFRQTDKRFIKALHQVRVGRLTKSSYELLRTRVGATLTAPNGVVPTRLVPLRRQADTINIRHLQELTTDPVTFEMENEWQQPQNQAVITPALNQLTVEYEQKYLASSCLCEKSITLKQGAQVMCVANLDMDDERPIVNGSQGVVVGFTNKMPRVLFTNGREMLMPKHSWSSERHPSVSIKQVPLILAWAVTIHKAQGATLSYAEVDAGSGVFECGQTYVALSRVRSLEGLTLTSFSPDKIVLDQKVLEFYEECRNPELKEQRKKREQEQEQEQEQRQEKQAEGQKRKNEPVGIERWFSKVKLQDEQQQQQRK